MPQGFSVAKGAATSYGLTCLRVRTALVCTKPWRACPGFADWDGRAGTLLALTGFRLEDLASPEAHGQISRAVSRLM
jgi:hypothetical protein